MTERETVGLKVLLVESNPQDAEMTKRALQDGAPGCTVLALPDRTGYVDGLRTFRPDVILFGENGSELPAPEAQRIAHAVMPEVPFVIVGNFCDVEAMQCLKNGAADFVRKTDSERLVPSIREALDLRAPLRKLSDRQRQVLRMLAVGDSTREIAEKLGVSVKTVETHRAELMRRLDIRDLAGLVRYAVRVGLVSATQESAPRSMLKSRAR